MVEPPRGLTREEIAARVRYIYEKMAKKEKLSHTEEQVLAYSKTAPAPRRRQ